MSLEDALRRTDYSGDGQGLRAAAKAAARGPRDFAASAGWLTRAAKALLLPLGLVLVWEVFSRTGIFPPNLLPSPTVVLAEILGLAESGDLATHIQVTVTRVAFGFLAGAAAATALGALTGYSKQARELLDPSLQALKSVPSLAWVPLFILWFGIFETSKVTLIAVGVFFPIYLNLMTGIQGVDRKLVEVGRSYNLSRLKLVRKILLPATLPSYFVGLRAGLALGWMFVIAAELMGASEGLGFLMIDGQMTGQPQVIIASLLLFAVLGQASDAGLSAVARRVLSWQDDFGRMRGGRKNA